MSDSKVSVKPDGDPDHLQRPTNESCLTQVQSPKAQLLVCHLMANESPSLSIGLLALVIPSAGMVEPYPSMLLRSSPRERDGRLVKVELHDGKRGRSGLDGVLTQVYPLGKRGFACWPRALQSLEEVKSDDPASRWLEIGVPTGQRWRQGQAVAKTVTPCRSIRSLQYNRSLPATVKPCAF